MKKRNYDLLHFAIIGFLVSIFLLIFNIAWAFGGFFLSLIVFLFYERQRVGLTPVTLIPRSIYLYIMAFCSCLGARFAPLIFAIWIVVGFGSCYGVFYYTTKLYKCYICHGAIKRSESRLTLTENPLLEIQIRHFHLHCYEKYQESVNMEKYHIHNILL